MKNNEDLIYIPYNKKLVSRAKELRKNTTVAEKKFWSDILQSKDLKKYKFSRQKPLDNFIVDFYCSRLGLVIEIDGDTHTFTRARDRERTGVLSGKYKLVIVRYTNNDVLESTDSVYRDLLEKIGSIEDATP